MTVSPAHGRREMARKDRAVVRKKIAEHYDRSNACFACGSEDSLDIAHILSVSHGGSDDLDNLAILCKRCHLDAPEATDPRAMWTYIHQRFWEQQRTIDFWLSRYSDYSIPSLAGLTLMLNKLLGIEIEDFFARVSEFTATDGTLVWGGHGDSLSTVAWGIYSTAVNIADEHPEIDWSDELRKMREHVKAVSC